MSVTADGTCTPGALSKHPSLAGAIPRFPSQVTPKPTLFPGVLEKVHDREAYLPAEQSSSQEEARIPQAYADPGRTGRPLAPPPQGPQASFRLIEVESRFQARVPDPVAIVVGGEGFGPASRMHERRSFVRCYRRGFRVHGPLVTLHVHARAHDGSPRLGITASRKVGKSVVRQRCKRRIREIFRRWPERATLGPLDVVVHVKPVARDASFSYLRSSLEKQLGKVVARTA